MSENEVVMLRALTSIVGLRFFFFRLKAAHKLQAAIAQVQKHSQEKMISATAAPNENFTNKHNQGPITFLIHDAERKCKQD